MLPIPLSTVFKLPSIILLIPSSVSYKNLDWHSPGSYLQTGRSNDRSWKQNRNYESSHHELENAGRPRMPARSKNDTNSAADKWSLNTLVLLLLSTYTQLVPVIPPPSDPPYRWPWTRPREKSLKMLAVICKICHFDYSQLLSFQLLVLKRNVRKEFFPNVISHSSYASFTPLSKKVQPRNSWLLFPILNPESLHGIYLSYCMMIVLVWKAEDKMGLNMQWFYVY